MNHYKMIGHEKLKDSVLKTIKNGKFSHANIIVGEDGIGKSIFAKCIAISILNKEYYYEHADIVCFKMKKDKKSIGVDDIRGLIEEINKKPYEGDKKVIIIYNGDYMTEAAQNAFLKTIEEPPQGVYLMILCENIENILGTVKSRCQLYTLNRLKNEEMKEFLKEKYPSLDEETTKLALTFSDGVPGKIEAFMESESFNNIRNGTLNIIDDLLINKKSNILEHEEFINEYKNEWKDILTWIISYVRDALIYKETFKKELIINIDKSDTIKEMAEKFSFNKLNSIISMVTNTRYKLERNVNTLLVFDTLLVELGEV